MQGRIIHLVKPVLLILYDILVVELCIDGHVSRGDRGIFGQNSSLPNLSEFLLSKTYIINFEIQPFDSHFSYVFKSFFEM